jgi:hypothetical protein
MILEIPFRLFKGGDVDHVTFIHRTAMENRRCPDHLDPEKRFIIFENTNDGPFGKRLGVFFTDVQSEPFTIIRMNDLPNGFADQ